MSASLAPGTTTPRSSGATTIDSVPGSRLGVSVIGACMPSPASTSRSREAEPVPSVGDDDADPAVAQRRGSGRRAPRRRRPPDRTRPPRAAACRASPGDASRLVAPAFVCASSRSNGSERRGKSWPSAPHVTDERLGQVRFLVEQLLRTVAHPAGLDEQRPRAPAGSRSGRRCSSSVSHGSQDSMPSKVWPSASRSHCARPHGAVCDELRGALPDLGRRQQLPAREDQRLGRARASLRWSATEKIGEPVDLVAPEIDAHRMVGGRRVDVDDRAAHRDLAAALDLVLAPVAHRDEPLEQVVAIDLRALAQRRSARRPRRAGRVAARARGPARRRRPVHAFAAFAQPPHDPEPATHRLERRARPARTAASPTPGRARPRRHRASGRGRRRCARPRRPSAPPGGSDGPR